MQLTTRNADYNRLMEASRDRARQLRREAAHEFWNYLGGVAAGAKKTVIAGLTRNPSRAGKCDGQRGMDAGSSPA